MKTAAHPLRCWWRKFKLWRRGSTRYSSTAPVKSKPVSDRRHRRTTCFFEMP
jgi:hypothetical protein